MCMTPAILQDQSVLKKHNSIFYRGQVRVTE